MAIKFTGKYTANTELSRVIFQDIVNGNSVACHISDEALQDIQPPCGDKSLSELYENYSGIIQEVATRLMLAGRVKNGQLHINSNDLKVV